MDALPLWMFAAVDLARSMVSSSAYRCCIGAAEWLVRRSAISRRSAAIVSSTDAGGGSALPWALACPVSLSSLWLVSGSLLGFWLLDALVFPPLGPAKIEFGPLVVAPKLRPVCR